jgi:hypothetical protein
MLRRLFAALFGCPRRLRLRKALVWPSLFKDFDDIPMSSRRAAELAFHFWEETGYPIVMERSGEGYAFKVPGAYLMDLWIDAGDDDDFEDYDGVYQDAYEADEDDD